MGCANQTGTLETLLLVISNKPDRFRVNPL